MVEVPEHLLQRSRDRRSALGLGGGDAGSGAPAAAAPAKTDDAGGATPAKAEAAAPAVVEPTGPAPSIGIPTAPVTVVKPRTRVPVWAMPVVAALPFWALLYQGAFGEDAHGGEEAAAGAVEVLPEGEPPADAVVIGVVNNAFEPASQTAKVGEVVAWVWQENGSHNITGGPLKSPTKGGGSYAVTFSEPASVSYRCTLHAGMEGTLEVTA